MSDPKDFELNEELQRARQKRRAEKRRKFIIKQRIFYGICAAILILIIVLIFKACSGGKKDTEDTNVPPDDQQQQEEQTELPTTPNTVTATLSAVGDIMVYDEQLDDAQEEAGVYNFAPCFADVTEALSASDLTVGNLELNFCGEPYSGYPQFNAPESLATALKNAGFDILQTANTYSIQNGIAGLQTTLSTVTSAGMEAIGTYASEADAAQNNGVLLKEVNGVKIAFFAFTKGVNNMSLPTGSEYAVDLLYTDYYTNYSQINEEAILAKINAAKNLEADVIVAMVHWGSEQETNANSTQTQIADLMFQNGVDVILGSHPHIVGGMEERTVTTTDGEEKTVFLAYSLGNFLSGMVKDYTQTSLILNLAFTKDLDTGVTTISSISYTPVYMQDAGANAAQRYQLLDIYKEIDAYVAAEVGCVDTETYNSLTSAVERLHAIAGEQYDIQNQQPAQNDTSSSSPDAQTPADGAAPSDADSQDGNEDSPSADSDSDAGENGENSESDGQSDDNSAPADGDEAA